MQHLQQPIIEFVKPASMERATITMSSAESNKLLTVLAKCRSEFNVVTLSISAIIGVDLHVLYRITSIVWGKVGQDAPVRQDAPPAFTTRSDKLWLIPYI